MLGMDFNVIIGNVCSLFAMGTDTLSASRKTARGVLLMQSISQVLLATGAILLGANSAAVQNGVSLLRNLRAATNKGGKWLEWVFLAVGVVLGVYCNFFLPNDIGIWLGMIPIIANVGYSLAVYFFGNDEIKLKITFLITNVEFIFFNFMIRNYVGFCTCIFVATATGIFVVKSRRQSASSATAVSDGKDSHR